MKTSITICTLIIILILLALNKPEKGYIPVFTPAPVPDAVILEAIRNYKPQGQSIDPNRMFHYGGY